MTDVVGITSGMRVGGYRVDELIGRGGIGQVHPAFDDRLERNVALKILAPGLADEAPFRERLLRESRLAASLDHPNVIPVYDAGEVDGRLYLAMRFVDGTDLRALLRREGVLPPERALAIVAQVADALDAAHERGLVQRDVKPSNNLLDRLGGREHAYLADFGLTQSATDTGPTDGRLMGTVDYVAPEQIRGDSVDGRADQYALACMLFECLTGTAPFARGSDMATIYAHLEEAPPSASEHNSDLPGEVDAALERAMAKAPVGRVAAGGGLVVAARRALGIALPARRSRRFAVGAAVAAVAALAIAVAVVVLSSDGQTPPAPTGALVRIDPGTNEVTHSVRLSR